MKRYALVFSFLLGAFALGFTAAPGPAAPNKKVDTFRYLDLFGAVFERVRNSYVEEVSDKKLIEAAINGMLSSLDPHSSYVSAEAYREMRVRTRGKFGGLGIEVTMENGLIKVVAPIDDTPAAKAGIQSGDLITHIDGKPILGMSLREAVTQMRGTPGSKIVIRIRRKGVRPFDVTIVRAIITIKSVRYRIEGNVGYVRITSFTQQSDVGLRRAVEEFKAKLGGKLIGIVLDLRNNPGGLLTQAVKVADVFLDKGAIVSTRRPRQAGRQPVECRTVCAGRPGRRPAGHRADQWRLRLGVRNRRRRPSRTTNARSSWAPAASARARCKASFRWATRARCG